MATIEVTVERSGVKGRPMLAARDGDARVALTLPFQIWGTPSALEAVRDAIERALREQDTRDQVVARVPDP